MSLFTSRYPHNHHVETQRDSLPESISTLAEVLKQAGYHTLGFASWVFLEERYGFARGFDVYQTFLPPRGKGNTALGADADEVLAEVVSRMRLEVSPPFFLFVHLFDPHLDYSPPMEHARLFDPTADPTSTIGSHARLSKYIKGLFPEPQSIPPADLERVTALYDGEIHFMDTELKNFFDQLGELVDDALIVFTSDHGEELDDHGSMEGHQWTLFDEIIHVPLIFKFPGDHFAGKRVNTLVQSIDIAPTILSFAGIDPPDGYEGRDLMPLIRGEGDATPGIPAFSSSKRFINRWSVRTDRYKLIHSERRSPPVYLDPPEYELYDLARDPRELEDIFGEAPEVAATLRRVLDEWRARAPASAAGPPVELSEETLERLRALGYSGDR